MTAPTRTTVRLTPDEALEEARHLPAHLPPDTAFFRVVRRAVDARHKKVRIEVTVELWAEEPPPSLLTAPVDPGPVGGPEVVVVGAGPAGLMAAFALLQAGLVPVVVERGSSLRVRHERVKKLRLWGDLDGAPALTCGLGGAGTYSDGKLLTRRSGPAVRRALALMAWFAQDDGLLVDSHPHVGSNRLPGMVDALRLYLEERGGRFLFETEAASLELRGGRVVGVRTPDGTPVLGEAVILAPGNSARALYAAMAAQGVAMEAKAFAAGFRLEHPRAWVDEAQYGALAGHPALGAARYALAFPKLSRAVYSFCMCPGGHLLPTPPEPGHLAVNGMSFSSRASKWSNAALVAAVTPEDWAALDPSPLGGVTWQRSIEAACYAVAGDYSAPAQRLTDFVAGRPSVDLPVSSYRPGLAAARVDELLPPAVVQALREGVRLADEKLRGYLQEEAVVVAPETLTSAPLRLLRDGETESPSHPGLHPCGEGCGWSGGITSSAADGLVVGERVSRAVLQRRPIR